MHIHAVAKTPNNQANRYNQMSVVSLLFSPPFLSDSHVCLHASICQCRCICLGIQLPVSTSVHLCSFAMCNQSSMHHCLLIYIYHYSGP